MKSSYAVIGQSPVRLVVVTARCGEMHQNSFTGLLRVHTNLLLLLLWTQQPAAMSPSPVPNNLLLYKSNLALLMRRRRCRNTSWGFWMVMIVFA
jgi:hypothetical protein